MNNTSTMLPAVTLFALLATAVFGMPDAARAQGNAPSAKTAESPFACNRLALTPEQKASLRRTRTRTAFTQEERSGTPE